MKRTRFIFASIISSFLLASCTIEPSVSLSISSSSEEASSSACTSSEHIHTYSDTWSYDSSYHYHEATCEHTDLVADKGAHTFVDTVIFPTFEEKGYTRHECSICHYSYIDHETNKLEHNYSSSWSSSDDNHYHSCLDEGYSDLKKDIDRHTYSEWFIDEDKTTDSDYSIYHKCLVCDHKEEKTINKYSNLQKLKFEDVHDNKNCYVSAANKNIEGIVIIPAKYNGWKVSYIGIMDNYSTHGNAFLSCDMITDVIIEGNTFVICDNGFKDCTSLETINFGPDITAIYSYSFAGCSSLRHVNLPLNLGTLSSHAFEGCNLLKEMYIPNTVSSLSSYSFMNCPSIEKYEVDITNPNFCSEDGVIFNKDKSILIACPQAKKGSYTIPYTVTSLDYYAFHNCSKLEEVILPAALKGLDMGTFNYCSSLKKMHIPNLVGISNNPFLGCTSLTEFSVDSYNKNVSVIDGVLFNKDKTELKAFPGGRSGSYTIPSSVTGIGYQAFLECENIEELTLSSKLTSISSETFKSCKSLRKINIPNGLTNIGDKAFMYCTSLESVTLPDSLTSLYSNAFDYCTSLASIHIGSGLQSSDEWYSSPVRFGYCPNLEEVTVSSSNQYYSSIDGVLYNKEQTSLLCCPNKKVDDFYYPETIASIGDSAFYGCDRLESISLPSLITSIGVRAFEGCTSLTSIDIPSTLTTIGEYAFYNCSSLEEISFASVTSLGRGVLSGCTSIKSVTLNVMKYTDVKYFSTLFGGVMGYKEYEENSKNVPESLKTIRIATSKQIVVPEYYFYGCRYIQKIYLPYNLTSIGQYAFSGCYMLHDLYYDRSSYNFENNVSKGASWKDYSGYLTVHCYDKDLVYKSYSYSPS